MPDNLTRAMKSALNAQAVKIKLTKKHTPCLTFEITLVSDGRRKILTLIIKIFQLGDANICLNESSSFQKILNCTRFLLAISY